MTRALLLAPMEALAHLRGRDAHAKFGGKYWRERFNHKILTNFVP